MKFHKYHALGNDYIVLAPTDYEVPPSPAQIRNICHRNYGIGSDGILWGSSVASDSSSAPSFVLRIFNPDGSEAEKSGNGLRIYSRYLWDQKKVQQQPFEIQTLGGKVTSQIHEDGASISIDMGQVSFDAEKIPVLGFSGEVLKQNLCIQEKKLQFCAATVGNPHCIILDQDVCQETACALGPLIEVAPCFPHQTNVQFLDVLDRNNICIEIWERGAGYTLASGSSSSAAAAVAHKLGLCDSQITVHMPGGKLSIEIAEDFSVLMTGPTTRICEGILHSDCFSTSIP